MSAATSIEWTDRTWNPLAAFDRRDRKRGWFCTKVSPGCANCYAEKINVRLGTGHPYVRANEGEVEFRLVGLDAPRRWRKPARVFVNSMTDLFHEAVPFELIDRVFEAMALAPQHTFQVLTKRAQRMREYMHAMRGMATMHDQPWPLPNVWLGVSAEDQQRADERIPELMRCPAAVRFVSAEPLLGAIDLSRWLGFCPACDKTGVIVLADGTHAKCGNSTAIGWVIVGGESGPRSRHCALPWVQKIVEQCQQAGCVCFVKQLGASPSSLPTYVGDGSGMRLNHPKGGDMDEWPTAVRVREFPTPCAS